MEFIKAIIKPSYWLTHQHPVPEFWSVALIIFFGVLVALGLIAAILASIKKFKKPLRTLFTKISVFGWIMGLLGYVLLFFSIQQVAFVSARLFYLFWFATAVWWAYYIVLYAVKDVPRLIEMQKKREEKEKYLPKKKK